VTGRAERRAVARAGSTARSGLGERGLSVIGSLRSGVSGAVCVGTCASYCTIATSPRPQPGLPRGRHCVAALHGGRQRTAARAIDAAGSGASRTLARLPARGSPEQLGARDGRVPGRGDAQPRGPNPRLIQLQPTSSSMTSSTCGEYSTRSEKCLHGRWMSGP
jgi:hypothetical protein